MKTTTLRCNNCGADLKINPKIKFFNCDFCGSSLTIRQSGNTTFTEVLTDIKDNTETLLDNSEVILVEKEIARLDRAWLIEQEQYKIHSKHGSKLPDESTKEMTIIGTILGLGFMFFWISMVSTIPGGGMPLIFGIVGIFMLIFNSTKNINKSQNYQTAKTRYKAQRNSLLHKLSSLKG